VPAGAVDLGDVIVMPGLVNAHIHLELSWLRGRVAPAGSFLDWVSAMMRERTRAADANDESVHRAAMREALADARACGTAVVGDTTNSLMGFDLLEESGLAGVVFHELIGFNTPAPDALVAAAAERAASRPVPEGWRIVPASHAPYSVSPGLFAAVRRACGIDGTVPTSVHVAEAADETELLASGGGRWPDVLRWLGAWDPSWTTPGCSPVRYLDRLGFWAPGTLAVHAVRTDDGDLGILRDRGATVVTCPRSNAFVGAGTPPVEAFYASGVRVAVGTDSLSSVGDLNLFSEIAELRRLAPGIPASRLLASATIEGARALGLDGEFGSIEAGKRAALIAIEGPAGAGDVEEYLLGGIAPSQVRWVRSGSPC
jgi:cytosine/adenosine deaminase-related metal-dependent hydrolase